jgi:methionyl-tRNA synthetase
MIERYRDGTIPAGEPTDLDQKRLEVLDRYRDAMDGNLLHQGSAAALQLANAANLFVAERAPWQQARDPDQAEALDATLASLARALATLATIFEPFMPRKMADLATALGLDSIIGLDDIATIDLAGSTINKGEVLFPRESE